MRNKMNAVLAVLLASLLLLTVFSCSGDSPKPEQGSGYRPDMEAVEVGELSNKFTEPLDFTEKLTPNSSNTVNPAKPYDGICWGLFEDQTTHSEKTMRNGSAAYKVTTDGKYVVFIPEHFQPKQKTIMVLTPDNITASEFAKTDIGKAWMAHAMESEEFSVAFVEPANGKTWNTGLEYTGRDERAFILDVTNALKKKEVTDTHPFISVDKNAMSIIGYKEGANMAAVLAAAWPALFPNTILIEPTKIEANLIESLLEENSFPHVVDNKVNNGNNVKNGDIGMPLYVYSSHSVVVDEVKRIWDRVNTNQTNQDSTLDKNLLCVTQLEDYEVETVYKAAANNNRFMGYPGGTVRERVDFSSANFEFLKEETVEGELVRRWSIYTPSGFDAAEKNPLVVVLHGSSASITDIAEETRWTDIADKEGFAVLFIQGYPKGTTPIPSWTLGSEFSPSNYLLEKNPDLQYIDQVITNVVEDKNIDTERIYLTGHSLGSMMTVTVMGSEIANRFAAFGPIGAFSLPNKDAPVKNVALWAMLGEFEGGESRYTPSLNAWGPLLSLEVTDMTLTDEGGKWPEGKYMSVTYNNEAGAPQMKFTKVMDSPHTYMAEEAELLWYDFFSHYKRVENESVYSE